jgi:hypothetical protein
MKTAGKGNAFCGVQIKVRANSAFDYATFSIIAAAGDSPCAPFSSHPVVLPCFAFSNVL